MFQRRCCLKCTLIYINAIFAGFYLAQKLCGGKGGLLDNLGSPKGVGVRWEFDPSRAKCVKLKYSFILEFTKSPLEIR